MTSYLVEFDTLAGHNPGTGAILPPVVLSLTGWRSIGNSEGGRFINRTGRILRAIYLKVNSGANSFTVTPASGGRLFDTIWVKQDVGGGISEAYFLDGNIPNAIGAFWMRIPRNTTQEIQDCDAGTACPFSGQAFDHNPSVPSDGTWKKIRSATAPQDARWAGLLSATPSEYRAIDAYAESPDGRDVLFLSHGEIFLYNHDSGTVSSVTPDKIGTVPLSNAIGFNEKSGAFELLHNGRLVRQIRRDSAGLSELGKALI